MIDDLARGMFLVGCFVGALAALIVDWAAERIIAKIKSRRK